jgi:DNA-binding NarL/FixJ family response regulator
LQPIVDKLDTVNRIFLAINQTIFRDGLSDLLAREPDLLVVGGAADGQETIRLAGELRPDIVVLDLSMTVPVAMGILRALAGPGKVRILVLADADQKSWIVEAFRFGARGVVLKDSAASMLLQAIRGVMRDQFWILDCGVADLETVTRKLAEPGVEVTRLRTFGLSARELQIVSAVLSGASNRRIARTLAISEATVKHHLTSIFDKLGICSRLELALFTIQNGLSGNGMQRIEDAEER